MKKSVIIAIIIMIILLLTLITFAFLTSPIKRDAVNKEFIIKSQTPTKQIVSDLKKANLIKSELLTLIIIKFNNKSVYAGTYELSQSDSLFDILDKLTSGKIKDTSIKITIQEGKNIRQIAKIVADKTNHSEQQFISAVNNQTYIRNQMDKYAWLTNDILKPGIYYPLEGYLFPDSYILKSKDDPVTSLLDKMLARTNKEIIKQQKLLNSSQYSVHQILTLASIVELEAIDHDSRSKVASVFYNRLNKRMSLGSDVTTYYANQVSMSERDLKKEELILNNPYNTRGPNMAGKLPIGPIGNAGAESIKATLTPEVSSYLYFVADKYKKLYFTNNITEHNNIIIKLKRAGLWYNYQN